MGPIRKKEDIARRRWAVLEMIVNCYVDSAEPVCSRIISRKMGLSSATIRHVMQELEEDGFIAQPHTSAGRIPTEKGYRYYVDFLMSFKGLTESQIRVIDAEYKVRRKSLDDIMKKTSHILSTITKYAGVVLLPKTEHGFFRHIDLIRIGKNRVHVFLITESGIAKDFIIDLDYDLGRDTLEKISHFLNTALYDMTLDQIKARLEEAIREERDSSYRIVQHAKDIMSTILVAQMESRLYIDGTSLMLSQPEFDDLRKMRTMLEFLEEETSLLNILAGDVDDPGMKILIGHEARTRNLRGASLVTCGYRMKDNAIGRLGVIGPTRMDYDRVVPLVNFLAETLTHMLHEIEG